MVEEERLKAILESLLFAAAEPVALSQLVSVIESVARDEIKKALGEMAAAYASGGRGIVLEEVAGGYQLRTPKEHALYVRKLLAAKPPRLSRPLLETVAIVAYRQPITRPEIEQLRGVDCGGVIDTLIERRLIKIAGRKEAPGRPMMYATTPEFLELFGLKDLGGLPDLEELREIENPREVPLFAKAEAGEPGGPSVGAEGLDYSTGSETVAADTGDPTQAHDAGVAEDREAEGDGESFVNDTAAVVEAAVTEPAEPAQPEAAAPGEAAGDIPAEPESDSNSVEPEDRE